MHASYKIALSLQNKIEKELVEMVRQGDIALDEGHSDWTTP